MKKQLLLITAFILAFQFVNATQFTVAISGFTYSPSTVNAIVGDTVVISASGSHPLVQVSEASWNAGSATPLSGGWGTKTSQYTHIITALGDIYYACSNHIGSGMKGKILVSPATGINVYQPEKAEFKMSPNPANAHTTMSFFASESVKKMEVAVYDITGKLVISTPVIKDHSGSVSTFTINTNQLTSGVYFVQLGLDNTVSTKKLYIE